MKVNGVTTSKYEGWRGTFQLYRYKTVVLVHPKGYLALMNPLMIFIKIIKLR